MNENRCRKYSCALFYRSIRLDNNLCKFVTRRADTKKMVQLKTLIGDTILLLAVLALVMPIIDQVIPIIILGVFGFALSLYLYLNSIKRICVVIYFLVVSFGAVFGLCKHLARRKDRLV
jgi:hypothetical protein